MLSRSKILAYCGGGFNNLEKCSFHLSFCLLIRGSAISWPDLFLTSVDFICLCSDYNCQLENSTCGNLSCHLVLN